MATLTTKYYNDTTHVVYNLDGDPTVFAWGNVNASNNSFLYRSDNGTLYMKTGPLSTDWTLVGPGNVQVTPTDGGEAGILGAGTALDPFDPVAGPYRPTDRMYLFDDYAVSYGPWTAGVPNVEGVGCTSILRTAGVTTQFSCNLAAGFLGPGQGSMMGVMDLQLIGAAATSFITATLARPGDDSGDAINMSTLVGNWDLWWAGRVSFEGLNNFEGSQKAFAGFSNQIDQPSFGNPDRAYFHPKDNGSQVNWFASYNIGDDNGAHTADVDTGVRVGFTAAHPLDGRAAQNLLVRFTKHAPNIAGENVTMTMSIDGVIVVTLELTNPTPVFTTLCALESAGAGQSNTMYVDWQLLSIVGRTV